MRIAGLIATALLLAWAATSCIGIVDWGCPGDGRPLEIPGWEASDVCD